MYCRKGIILLICLAMKREMKSGECGVYCNYFLSSGHLKFLIVALENVPLFSMLDPWFFLFPIYALLFSKHIR